ncbi:MAG: lipopolysaccharide heptosyltransferase II [Candidatus Omnitrophica bacterium]|nr:lipopolysaccharide heptosyltransferase II [Candidatus Omnitrophota bacterium]MCM8792921.1 lipopolysaccharide heptosyltransferase II [Candidatus Omnitrophota bacterium]
MLHYLEKIKKILVITLSNIGDVILTTPVIENLKTNFPQSALDVLVGPRGKEVLEKDRKIRSLIIYDKHASLRGKLNLIKKLGFERYDLVVDLRQTIIPFLIHPPYHTPFWRKIPKNILHMRDRHLFKIKNQISKIKYQRPFIYTDKSDEDYIYALLEKEGINTDNLIVISPGARSSTKSWPVENFIELIKRIKNEFKVKFILVGSQEDFEIARKIKENTGEGIINFAGKTTISQLAVLLKKAKVLITNDSAVLHCGSAVNIPTLAIFGPTDPLKYGPLAENSLVLRKLLPCVPCEKAQCRYGHKRCLDLVRPWEVFWAVKRLLQATGYNSQIRTDFKRILVIRTDRIGDVVLSTPVIKNLRDHFPQSFIVMMVRPYTKEIVEDNPYLDEVIIYDKDKKDKSLFATLRFILRLRKYKFDLAIILHPTNRVHLISFLAGIRKRIGYDKKMGFFNTDRFKERKYLGEKHELEYNLDFLRYLGIEPEDKRLFVPVNKEAEERVNSFLKENGLDNCNFIVIHPGASCPSKIWPAKNFAFVCDMLIKDYGFKILLITDKKNSHLGKEVRQFMKYSAVLATGKFSLKELAVVLKRAKLFISNDSGPVHIAVAVGTPVISIFGRKQPGLSPKRWGPLGEKDIVLHKDVGCSECLAHNCKIGFECLKAITPKEVLEAVGKIIA